VCVCVCFFFSVSLLICLWFLAHLFGFFFSFLVAHHYLVENLIVLLLFVVALPWCCHCHLFDVHHLTLLLSLHVVTPYCLDATHHHAFIIFHHYVAIVVVSLFIQVLTLLLLVILSMFVLLNLLHCLGSHFDLHFFKPIFVNKDNIWHFICTCIFSSTYFFNVMHHHK
jgi:hypothetical protein